jgi:hypothetical protein
MCLFGGPSQLETFDMKPMAASKVRGPYLPIACRTPDLLISEKLSRCAAISDQFAVVRTLSHSYNDHSGGSHYIQTGKRWQTPIGAGFNAMPHDWPSIGSVVDYLDQSSDPPPPAVNATRDLPNYFVLPNSLGRIQTYSVLLKRPGEYAGWLGRGYDPVTTLIDKRTAEDNPYYRNCSDDELTFQIEGLLSPAAISLDRIERRQSLLTQFDQQLRRTENEKNRSSYDKFRQRALALVSSERTRRALDLRQEPDSMRDP